MSQSRLLTNALEAVERVLEAETEDLIELANIAGIDPNYLYSKADLTGIDLRNTDIDFLLPLQTKFESAILSDAQRFAFRKHSRQQIKQGTKRKIQDLRAQAVAVFIEKYERREFFCHSALDKKELSPEYLRKLLLYPLHQNSPDLQLTNSIYTNAALSSLATWVSDENFAFFAELFSLLGNILSPVDSFTGKIIKDFYYQVLEEKTAGLLSRFHPTAVVDDFWFSIDGPEGVLARVHQLGSERKVSATAIEKNLVGLDWEDLLCLYSTVPFDCDTDQAERLSIHLIGRDWPASETIRILRSKTHPKIRNAIFRQLLGQGNQERIVEVIRWLEDNRGAAGALSLENAFVHIREFDLAFQLAKDLASRLAPYQIAVVEQSLRSLVNSGKDRAQLDTLMERYQQ